MNYSQLTLQSYTNQEHKLKNILLVKAEKTSVKKHGNALKKEILPTLGTSLRNKFKAINRYNAIVHGRSAEPNKIEPIKNLN